MALIQETTEAPSNLDKSYVLAVDDIFAGTVAGPDEVDRVWYPLQAGQTYSVILSGLYGNAGLGSFGAANYDGGSNYLSVRYGDGTLNSTMAGVQVTDLGGAWRATFTASVTGEYGVFVDDNGDPLAGTYRISLIAGDGAVASTTTVTDTGSAPWSSYTDSFDAGGNLVLRVMQYDDGRTADTVFANGVKASTTVTDTGGSFGWSSLQTFYAVDGSVTGQTNTYDDGRLQVITFESGQRAQVQMTDVANAYGWASYTDFYADDGGFSHRVMILDDGRRIDTRPAGGAFSGPVTTETADAASGFSTSYTLNPGEGFAGSVAGADEIDRVLVTLEAGVTYTATLQGLYGGGGNGSFSVSYNGPQSHYWSAKYDTGALNSQIDDVTVVDTGGAWQVSFVAPENGEYSFTVDDNGDAFAGAYEIAIVAGNGSPHRSITVTDQGNAYPWQTYTNYIDSGGDRVMQVMTLDSGIRRETEYSGGLRTLLRDTDVEDDFVWTRYTDTFDGAGARTTRTMVMDTGQIVETEYSGGVRSTVTQTDAPDDFVWNSVETLYDAGGQRTQQTNTYDDGRVLVNTYAGGVLSGSVMTDVDDAYAWASYADSFDGAGNRVERTLIMDDGSEVVTSFTPPPDLI